MATILVMAVTGAFCVRDTRCRYDASMDMGESSLVDLLREVWHLKSDDPKRRPMLDEIARGVLMLRRQFTKDDGTVDWLGESRAYKDAYNELYEHARVPADFRPALKSTIRSRLQRVRGEVIPLEVVREAGLDPDPVASKREARARSAAKTYAGGDGESQAVPTRQAIRMAASLLEQVAAASVVELATLDPDEVRGDLARVQAALDRLSGSAADAG